MPSRYVDTQASGKIYPPTFVVFSQSIEVYFIKYFVVNYRPNFIFHKFLSYFGHSSGYLANPDHRLHCIGGFSVAINYKKSQIYNNCNTTTIKQTFFLEFISNQISR